jgi:uncharacterized protein (TIGR02246 family)
MCGFSLQVDVQDAREFAPGAIAAHLRAEVRTGDQAQGEVRQALLTLVIARRAGLWRIIAAHNTAVAAPAG